MRHQLIALGGVVERNWYLVKRYAWWELAFFVWTAGNTLTIVFIGKGVEAAGGEVDVNQLTTILLIGAVIWSYPRFEILTEDRPVGAVGRPIEHVHGPALARGAPVRHGPVRGTALVRATIVFVVIAAFGLEHARRELRLGARAAGDRLGVVHRHRDDDRGPAADLTGEGDAGRLHRAELDARRVGCLLPR